MDDSETLPTISGHDVIMAYGEHLKYYNQPCKDRRVCTCFFWSRYSLFVLNFFVLAIGVTIIGFGAWAQVSGTGLKLFQTLLTLPSWLMIGTGVVMVLMGMFGCTVSIRPNLCCIRTFMMLVVAVFTLHVTMGMVLFFLMDDLHFRMLSIVKSAVINYQNDDDLGRDEALNYLQREFSCCGGSSYADWETNIYYNCSNVMSASSCGVPSSCCRGTRDEQCGHGVRYGTKEYSDMFTYTEGCIESLTGIFKEKIIVVTALAFSVCFLEICCLALSRIILKHITRLRKQQS